MTDRLTLIAVKNWRVLQGYAVGHGIGDLRDMKLELFTAFVYWMFTQNKDETEVGKFDSELWRPVKGEAPDKRSPWSPENETAAFQAIRQKISGK